MAILVTIENIDELLSDIKEELHILLMSEKEVYVDFLTKQQYRSKKQNKTFHALLDCFWDSGCSSFVDENDMRFHYKKSVGLIDMVFENTNLTEETKQMLWKAIKILPLETNQRIEVINLLRGKVEKERSWAVATKKQATRAIYMILSDMNEAQVITSSEGKHYENILEGMNADKWWDRS